MGLVPIVRWRGCLCQRSVLLSADSLCIRRINGSTPCSAGFFACAANRESLITTAIKSADYSRRLTCDLLIHYIQSFLIPLLQEKCVPASSIARYIPEEGGHREFQLIFPRQVNGKDVLSADDKSLQFEFYYPVVEGIGDGKGFIEFKTDKMKVNNKIVY